MESVDDLNKVLKLQKSQRFSDIMQKVEDTLHKDCEIPDHGMEFEDYDIEYQLIVDCNAFQWILRMRFVFSTISFVTIT